MPSISNPLNSGSPTISGSFSAPPAVPQTPEEDKDQAITNSISRFSWEYYQPTECL